MFPANDMFALVKRLNIILFVLSNLVKVILYVVFFTKVYQGRTKMFRSKSKRAKADI